MYLFTKNGQYKKVENKTGDKIKLFLKCKKNKIDRFFILNNPKSSLIFFF